MKKELMDIIEYSKNDSEKSNPLVIWANSLRKHEKVPSSYYKEFYYKKIGFKAKKVKPFKKLEDMDIKVK